MPILNKNAVDGPPAMNIDLRPDLPAGAPLPDPRYYAAEWVTDPTLFANAAARTPANSWTDGTFLSQVRRFTVGLPKAQWDQMKVNRHIYFRAGAGSSPAMAAWAWSVITDCVVNHMPTADAGVDQKVPLATGTALATSVSLDGSSSSDPDGGMLTYEWTLIGPPAGCFDTVFLDSIRASLAAGGAQATAFPAGTVFTESCEGTYVFRVEVTDSDPPSFLRNTLGRDSAETRVTIGSCVNTICIDSPTAVVPAQLVRPESTYVDIPWRMDVALHQQLQSLFAGNNRLRIRIVDTASPAAPPVYELYEPLVPIWGAFIWNMTQTNGNPAPAATYDIELDLVDSMDAPIVIPGFTTSATQSAAIVLDEFKAKIVRGGSSTFADLGTSPTISYQVTAPLPPDKVELVVAGPAGTTRMDVAGPVGTTPIAAPVGGPYVVTVEVTRSGVVVATSNAHEVFVLADTLVAGPNAVGTTSYTAASDAAAPAGVRQVTLPMGDGYPAAQTVNIAGAVWYPATVAGAGTPVAAGAKPLVLMVHGNHAPGINSYTGYGYLGQHLASHGFIAASVDMDSMNGYLPNKTIVYRAHVLNANLERWLWKASNDPRFAGKVDLSRVSLIGHSRGGEAVVQAVRAGTPPGVTVQAVVSIAPTDFMSLTHTGPPYLVLYGSTDGDVFTATGFRLYDRASARKAQVYLYGATHNDFMDHVAWRTERTEPPPSRVLPRAITRAAAMAWINSFLQWVVNGKSHDQFYFDAQNTPRSLRALAPGATWVKSIELVPTRMIDRFSAPPITAADSGASIAEVPGGSLVPFDHASFRFTQPQVVPTYDTWYMQQDTAGGLVGWTGTAKYVMTLGSVDVSAFRVFTVRMAQALSPGTPPADPRNPGVPMNAKVTMTDAAGKTATTDFASFRQAVPYPYVRNDLPTPDSFYAAADMQQCTLSPFQSVRVPLWAFTELEPKLDLTKMASVSLDFAGTGFAAIDDIGFSL